MGRTNESQNGFFPECPAEAHKPYWTLLAPPVQWMIACERGLQSIFFLLLYHQLVNNRVFLMFRFSSYNLHCVLCFLNYVYFGRDVAPYQMSF